MSRGPGRIERAILAAVDAEPDNAFTVDDLCERVFTGLNRIEKKHRVSVGRAAKSIARRNPHLELMWSRFLVLFAATNVLSYAMARLKSDSLYGYRPTARSAKAGWWIAREMGALPVAEQEARLRATLAPGGDNYRLIVEGGAWWRHAEIARTRSEGDAETLARLEAEQEKAVASIRSALVRN